MRKRSVRSSESALFIMCTRTDWKRVSKVRITASSVRRSSSRLSGGAGIEARQVRQTVVDERAGKLRKVRGPADRRRRQLSRFSRLRRIDCFRSMSVWVRLAGALRDTFGSLSCKRSRIDRVTACPAEISAMVVLAVMVLPATV